MCAPPSIFADLNTRYIKIDGQVVAAKVFVEWLGKIEKDPLLFVKNVRQATEESTVKNVTLDADGIHRFSLFFPSLPPNSFIQFS